MQPRRSVLVIDDGELDVVREVLEELGIEFDHVAGAKVREPGEPPERLLVTTAALAVAGRWRRGRRAVHEPPIWVAFVTDELKSQRRALRDAGFDFLVRPPVHPAALRLLFLRALYEGTENRRAERHAVGCEIVCGGTLVKQKAILTDLSARGCRILTTRKFEEGGRISVQMPAQATGSRALQLEGAVVRVAAGEHEGGESGQNAVGVRFTRLTEEQRACLRVMLRERLEGPATLSRAPAPRKNRSSPSPESEPAGSDRRQHPRGHFEKQVSAFLPGATRVLIARDLSEGGMRVEPSEHLTMGKRIRLALQGNEQEEPVLVEARVIRDDGPAGLALHFDWLDPNDRPRLQGLVRGLPRIADLQEEDTPTLPMFLTRILPMGRGRGKAP